MQNGNMMGDDLLFGILRSGSAGRCPMVGSFFSHTSTTRVITISRGARSNISQETNVAQAAMYSRADAWVNANYRATYVVIEKNSKRGALGRRPVAEDN